MDLIVCSDQLLLENHGRINNICNELTEHIRRGNRFLLTTRKCHSDLFEWDFRGFIPCPSILDRKNFKYTEVSCEDGLFLYDADGKVINCNSLSQEAVKTLRTVGDKDDNVTVFETRPWPKISAGDDDIAAICFNLESPKHRKKTLKLINQTISEIKTGEKITCNLTEDPSREDIMGYRQMYEVRLASSTEDGQIAYLKDSHGILDESVLDLRNTDPQTIEGKIKAFRRRNSKFKMFFR